MYITPPLHKSVPHYNYYEYYYIEVAVAPEVEEVAH